jgi:predicted nicotinamide N-methyase
LQSPANDAGALAEVAGELAVNGVVDIGSSALGGESAAVDLLLSGGLVFTDEVALVGLAVAVAWLDPGSGSGMAPVVAARAMPPVARTATAAMITILAAASRVSATLRSDLLG